MSKFFVWLLAIFLLIVSSLFVFSQNLYYVLLRPESLKKTLVEIDFYRHSKAIIKSNFLLKTDLNYPDKTKFAEIIDQVIDNYRLDYQLNLTIDDVYRQFQSHPENIVVRYDLTSFNSELVAILSDEFSVPKAEIFQFLPDYWEIDLTNAGSYLKYASFFYRNNLIFLLLYLLLWLAFLILCLKLGRKHLNLFFVVLLLVSLMLFTQYLLFYFSQTDRALKIVSVGVSENITNKIVIQGNSGLKLLMENLIIYLRQKFLGLLIWESLLGLVVSIIGLIAVRVIRTDGQQIPLND